jgi:TonB family protein
MNGRLCMVLFIIVFFTVGGDAQSGGTEPPTLISSPQPIYPKEAKDDALGGKVTVRVTVGESGEVLSVDEESGPARLCTGANDDRRLIAMRTSVVDAIRKAKFLPAKKNGKPVKMTISMSSHFDPVEEKPLPLPPGERRIVRVGLEVVSKARHLPKPEYPRAARSSRASGPVSVSVVLDESGGVITAQAVSGHPLLRPAAESVACEAKFTPTEMDGAAVRVAGVLTYIFFREFPDIVKERYFK